MGEMKSFATIGGLLSLSLGLCFCALATAQPYYHRLDSETISEAFQFGRHNDEPVGVFLSKYVRTFPTPPKGPYIGRIEVRTPYAQVVYAAKDDLQNDSEFDAVQKFGGVKLPVVVLVRVYWPATNRVTSMQDSQKDMWKQFPIAVSQAHTLTANKKALIPFHSYAKDMPRFDYTDMRLEFSAAQVSSEMLTVVASSPDGQHVSAKFDLAELK